MNNAPHNPSSSNNNRPIHPPRNHAAPVPPSHPISRAGEQTAMPQNRTVYVSHQHNNQHQQRGTNAGIQHQVTQRGLQAAQPRLASNGMSFPQVAPAPTNTQQSHSAPAWTVPNPLMQGQGHKPSSFVPPQPSIHQRSGMQHTKNVRTTTTQSTGPGPGVRAGVSVSSSTSTAPSGKPKVVLSPEARKALAHAIWSAIKSPDGRVDPKAMEAAVAAGLPRHAIMNAARVAREREAAKRKQQQQQQQQSQVHPPPRQPPHPQQQQQQQQQPPRQPQPQHVQPVQQQIRQLQHHRHPAQAAMAQHAVRTAPAAPARPPTKRVIHHTQQQMPAPSRQIPVHPQPVPASVPRPSAPAIKYPSTTPPTSAPRPASHAAVDPSVAAKLAERNHWKRVQSGVFMVQKGRFQALTHSVSSLQRSSDNSRPAYTRKRPRHVSVLEAAMQLQKKLRGQPSKMQLLDPEHLKRLKLEPKRIAKALDRSLKKNRTTTAESLTKAHKELSKAIHSHQSEFLKYHRLRKAELSKLAKSVRDRFNKQIKQEQKTAEQAERARLAALRANDMVAYSKLLEDTKNERLKFLLGKTDECISQISKLLQSRHGEEGQQDSSQAESYYTTAHFKTEEVRQPSILVGGDLKEYQLAGLQWMVSLYNNRLNGILADEMGLGKTIQAISLVSYLMEFKENLGPYLVIVPLSTLSNWVNEFAKWCPTARVIVYKGNPAQRRELYKAEVRNGQFNVLLTTYEYIIKDKGSLKKLAWQYAIVDEGHRMKNAQSKFAVTLGTQYTTKNRILLTGTPLQNNLPELWALLNFLLPSIFNSVESFDQWFNRPFAQFSNASSAGTDDSTDQMLNNEERMLIIHRLHELLRPFMLRRVKSEVLDQLPEKVEKVLRCELSSWQRELYKQISARAKADKSLVGSLTEPPTRGLNNVVMQLRKVCNHPYLFSPEGYHINENMILSSGKLELLDRMLPKLKAAGHRVLMFTQMTAVMTILEDYFAFRGYCSLRLDGSTAAEEREKRMYKFNAPDSPYFIFLLSTRAGGLGLNLATADVVVIFDSDWNPMMDLQAQDRAHRIGQRSDVSVFRLVTYSPVEEKILSRATEKLNMSELVVEAGKFDKSSVENDNSLERKRMMEVLLTDFDTNVKHGSQAEHAEVDPDGGGSEADSVATDKEDLNELLSNNEADFQLYQRLDAEGRTNQQSRLFTDTTYMPDWIKNPARNKQQEKQVFDPNSSRKRKAVAYDDGLTEKQFLRMMEKQADADEEARSTKKRSRTTKVSKEKEKGELSAGSNGDSLPPGTLTEWTFRKLISTCRSVIALKDPATKRRLSDIFLEKPDANTYPDYYEIIEKPIAINDILRKCRGHLHASLQEFWDDWKLLFSNARKYNGDDSWVVKDAESLQKELERVMKKNGFDDTPPPPPKRKPLRIKLSLKAMKSSAQEGDSSLSSEPKQKRPRSGKNGKSKA